MHLNVFEKKISHKMQKCNKQRLHQRLLAIILIPSSSQFLEIILYGRKRRYINSFKDHASFQHS